MLRVKLFGAGQASHLDRELIGFPGQQAYLLLCYLMLNRSHPLLRERLAAVFWGELTSQASRKSLRNALWRLRHGLESIGASPDDYLLIGDESVALLTSDRCWLDVEAFETTVARYQDISGQKLTPEDVSGLEGAVDLYSGDLLEGIYDDWCLYDRERLRLAHLSTLNKLMAFHEMHGTYERGLAYGERVLARDPTRENVHQQMMRLYWLAGDRNAALAQYKRCCQILHDEVATGPMDATKQLYEQMVNDRFDRRYASGAPEDRQQLTTRTAGPIEPLAGHILQKLQLLHTTLEETRTELHQLEHLISTALDAAGHS